MYLIGDLFFIKCLFYLFVFFFKQKTAYEMRISDWSSDVCSSDLQVAQAGEGAGGDVRRQGSGEDEGGGEAAHEIAECRRAGDVAAKATVGLGQRALDDGDALPDPLARGDAGNARAVEADDVHFDELSEGSVPLGPAAAFGTRRDNATHPLDKPEERRAG